MTSARRFLFFAVALMLVTALVSCATPTPEIVKEVVKETVVVEKEVTKEVEKQVVVTATPAPGEVKLGGTLTYVLNQRASNLDPGSSFYAVDLMVQYQVYDQLLWIDSDLNLQPGLAKSWTNNDDYTVFDFELRDDVKFHDGEPFNADAVIAWFDRILDPDYPIGGIVQWMGQIDKIEKTGEYSVRFTLTESNIMWLQAVAGRFSGIGSPKAAAELGDEFSSHPVGTGPFVFEEWLTGSHITLKKNPDYTWGSPMFGHSGPAYLDEVVFKFIEENATRTAALESGEADVVANVPYADAGILKEEPGIDILSIFILGTPQFNAINVSKPPTDDIRVRKAVLYAADKQGIVDIVYFGLTVPSYGPVTQWDKGAFNPELKNMYPYDPEKAKALLEEAGWVDTDGDGIREKDGEKLELTMSRNEGWIEWLEYLQANLRDVGIDSKIDSMAGAAYTDYAKNCTAHLPGMGGVSIDPLDLKTFFGGQATINWPCVDDPVLDQLIADAEATTDLDERNEIIKQIQMHMMENAYELPTVELAFHTGIRDNVKGVRFNASGFYPWLYDAYILPD